MVSRVTKWVLLCFCGFTAFVQAGDNCASLFKTKSYAEALSECREGSIEGDAASKYWLSLMYLDGLEVQADTRLGLKLLEESAYLGFNPAVRKLADHHWNGNAIEKNASKACDWWEKAARAGDLVGMEKYGVCYMLGRGRNKDIATAYRYLKEASDQGSAGAVYIVERYRSLFPAEEQSLSSSP